jgi:hypothetical protein
MKESITCSACQAETQDEFGIRRSPNFLFGPYGLVPWMRRHLVPCISAARYLRVRGLAFTLRKSFVVAGAAVRARLRKDQPKAWKTPVIDSAVLNLQMGDWIEVKPLEEILQTLDSQGKNHGLFFTNEMKLHCGRRYRVFKRVESIFNEFTKEQRKVQNTVLLETVFCQGEGLGCCRSCFHMWREAWLRRAPGPALEVAGGAGKTQLAILQSVSGNRQ